MQRPFNTKQFLSLVEAEERAHTAAAQAIAELAAAPRNDDEKFERKRRTEQAWFDAHFERLSYEH
jgi:hypothetical protein